MPRKRFTNEQIAFALRQAENGASVDEVCRKIGLAGLGDALARRLPRPTLAAAFDLPTNRRIERPLIGGAALFGIGWGLSGLCPGPAVAALSTGARPVMAFVVAMLAGMAGHQRFVARA